MKKKLIAIAIAAAVAAPLTAQAGIDMSGDARVRYYTNDIDANAPNPAMKGAQTDSRVSLNITGTDGKVAMAKVRLEIVNGGAVGGGAPAHGGNAETINVDHAYISANVGAGVRVTGGKTIANWGHKFVLWDSPGDRVSITKKMGDMAFGLHFSKGFEAGLAASTDDKQDTSGTHLTFTMGKMGGIRHDIVKNDAAGTEGKRTALYGGAPLVDGWGLGFSYATVSGDAQASLNGSDGGDNATGLMLAAMGKVADTDLTVGYSSAADGFNTDNDFFTFAGTGAQAGSMLPGLQSSDGNKMTGLFVIAKMKVNVVDLELGAASIKSDMAGDPSNTLMSIRATHALSKSSKVVAEYGTFSGDMLDASTMGARIETKF